MHTETNGLGKKNAVFNKLKTEAWVFLAAEFNAMEGNETENSMVRLLLVREMLLVNNCSERL